MTASGFRLSRAGKPARGRPEIAPCPRWTMQVPLCLDQGKPDLWASSSHPKPGRMCKRSCSLPHPSSPCLMSMGGCQDLGWTSSQCLPLKTSSFSSFLQWHHRSRAVPEPTGAPGPAQPSGHGAPMVTAGHPQSKGGRHCLRTLSEQVGVGRGLVPCLSKLAFLLS